MPMRHKTKNYNRIPRLNTHKLNAKVKIKKENIITNARKCFLYNSMLSHLEDIYGDDTLYEILLSIGFTEEEIEYEGLMPEDNENLSDNTEYGCNCKDEENDTPEIHISCEECEGCDCEDGNLSCCCKNINDNLNRPDRHQQCECNKCNKNEECECDGICGSHPCTNNHNHNT